jgi:uncharacterized protein (DUF1501 family)
MSTIDIDALSRRTFLQGIAMGALAGSTFGALGERVFGDVPDAWAAPAGANDGLLVLVTLFGGNDGLNTFVPYGDAAYYGLRGAVSIPAADVHVVDGVHGFHPSLPYLAALYRNGNVAAVQGLGMAEPDLSHFASSAIWMRGSFGAPDGTGWIGRWLDGLGHDHGLPAVAVSMAIPPNLTGRTSRAIAVPVSGAVYGTERRAADLRLYDALRAMASAPSGRGAWHDTLASNMRRQLESAAVLSSSLAVPTPAGDLTRQLAMAANLLNADVGIRVVDVTLNGFDHHEHQLGAHARLLADLDTGLRTFFASLSPSLLGRTTLLVISEFGRTPRANGSAGTDHGTANTSFVVGANVRGGTYGTAPSLTSLDANGRLVATMDFRSLYGSVLDGWMGGGAGEVLGRPVEDLHLFASAPSGTAVAPPPIEVVVPSTASGFVPMSPVRALDTRDGTGGRRGPLGPGEQWTLGFSGAAAAPAGAIAVAMNVTAVGATAASYVVAWPAGAARPLAANLNPVPGLAVPNLVVSGLGAGGAVSLYNFAGQVHLVADVVGWFTTDSSAGITAVTPSRLLDTRDGTGVTAPGPIPEGGAIDVVVAGRSSTPATAAAVVMNLTVTEPTAPSFVTAWPAGADRPLAASANMVAGQTVSNLVVAQLGAGGAVSLFNRAGETHLVADVIGYVDAGSSGRFVPVTPSRLLDTRDGTGVGVAGQVRADDVRLAVVGRGPVPWHGVTAVLVNLTAVAPTDDTFVTVYPSGEPRPWAANLTVDAGRVVPNMVLARVGTDGCILLGHHRGAVDLVVDVMGYVIGG